MYEEYLIHALFQELHMDVDWLTNSCCEGRTDFVLPGYRLILCAISHRVLSAFLKCYCY